MDNCCRRFTATSIGLIGKRDTHRFVIVDANHGRTPTAMRCHRYAIQNRFQLPSMGSRPWLCAAIATRFELHFSREAAVATSDGKP